MLLVTAVAARAAEEAAPDPSTLPRDVVVIVTEKGVHRFSAEIADDPVERARGLMYRESMARDHGMLFDYGAEGERTFWMKNTLLPLDLVFARADGTIMTIARGEPLSTDQIPSEGPARFVFEVNAGVAAMIGLDPGDMLLHNRVKSEGDSATLD